MRTPTHTRAHTPTHQQALHVILVSNACAHTHTHTHTVTHGHTLLHHWSQEAQKWRKKIKETKNKKNKQATNTRRSPWPDFVHQAEVGSADVESLEVNEDHHELLPRHNGSAVSMAEVVLQEMSHLLSNSTSVLMRIIMNCSLDTMAPLSAWRKLYCKRCAIFCQTLQLQPGAPSKTIWVHNENQHWSVVINRAPCCFTV